MTSAENTTTAGPDLRDKTSVAIILGDTGAIELAMQADLAVTSADAVATAQTQSPGAELATPLTDPNTPPTKAPAQITQVGFFNDADLVGSIGNDVLEVTALIEADAAQAIGIKNRGSINGLAGLDTLAGAGIALAGSDAVAFGIRNDGVIDLGADADVLFGYGEATGQFGGAVNGAALAFGYSELDTTENGGASRLATNDGDDIVVGTAIAFGTEDVGAFGLVFENADTGNGNDIVFGQVLAIGNGSTEGRGVSIGRSDVDDDALSPPEVFAAIGTLSTGTGNDVVQARTDLVVNARAGDQLFFAGSNGILIDGGVESQLIKIVSENAQALVDAAVAQAAGDRFAISRAVQPLLAHLTTSTLDLGAGNDTLISNVTMDARTLGFEVDPDDDLELIAEAIENSGNVRLGDGNDRVEVTTTVRSDIDGAKLFADALDNAGIGLLSGYSAIATQVLTDKGLIGAGSANPQVTNVEVEVTDHARFDLGAGDDTVVTRTFASAIDDIPSADGLSNRGVFIGGNDSDTLDLNNVSVFAVGEILNGGNDGEQREGISDGWESRHKIYLDDITVLADGTIVEGSTTGDGNDLVKTDATAFGNGVLTISDGFEGREFTSTGGGNDTFDVTGRAFTTARADQDTVGILASNVTAATGLQTEQVDEGDFLMRSGNDRIIGRALAAPALGVDGQAFNAADFAPDLFDPHADLFLNRTTIAQGISQVTADTLAVNDGSRDRGLLDTSGGGTDADTLDGAAVAFGVSDVQSYGLLLTHAVTGAGNDTLTGDADGTGRNVAFVNGIAVGISANTDNDGRALRPDQIGTLTTGSGNDLLTGLADATTTTDGTRRVATGLGDGSVVVSEANADSNGILIDLGSTLDIGSGLNRVTGTATARDLGIGGINTAVTADGIENRGALLAGGNADVIVGTATATSQGGVLLTLTGGIDNGFGSTRNAIPNAGTIQTGEGADRLEGTGTVVALSGIGLSSGIESSGLVFTGGGNDVLSGVSSATVTNGINAVADRIENADIAGLGGGLIDTGSGNDTPFARATATGIGTRAEAIAIRNDFVDLVNNVPNTVIATGRILLGGNDDVIDAFASATTDIRSGEATAIGIRGGSIDAGSGNDRLTAGSNQVLLGEGGVTLAGGRGLGGDVAITMGAGNDTVAAFGQARVSGGTGTDTFVFAFTRTDFFNGGGEIILGNLATKSVDFTFGGETLTTDGFEFFTFAAEPTALAYDDLLIA